MDTKQNTNTVRRLYEEVYSKGNLDLINELFSSNLKLHDSTTKNLASGVEAFKDLERTYQRAFPNKKVKIEDITVADNKVIVRWSSQGKHEGQFQDNSPTHRTFNITGISIYQFTNGKITEAWHSWDRLSLLEQLGIIQPASASY